MRAVGENADGTAPVDPECESTPAHEHADENSEQSAVEDFEVAAEDTSQEGDFSYEPSRGRWIAPALTALAATAWTGFFGWAMSDQLAGVASIKPQDWATLIIDWSIPIVLIGLIWMIAMRNSHAEASRFANSAALLSRESRQLEDRLTVVNRELSLAREFLASQSRELDSLGRIASERISAHAGELQQLIEDNGAQVDRIGSASETALTNMGRLRDDLPVVANSARDVTNQIGNAGRTAKERVENLVSGFERLNEFGKASETQVAALGSRIENMLGGFGAELIEFDQKVTQRFETLKSEATTYREQIDEDEAAALGAMNERLSALQTETNSVAEEIKQAELNAAEQLSVAIGRLQTELSDMIQTVDGLDRKAVSTAQQRIKELHKEAGRFDDTLAQRDVRFLEEMERRQSDFETREAQASELLAQRLAELDEALAERRETQMAETAKLVEHSQAISNELETFNTLIAQINDSSENSRLSLSEGIANLQGKLGEKRLALNDYEKQLEKVTEASVRLLEIIQSGAKHSREDLPEAIGTAANALSTVEQRAAALCGVMFQTKQQSGELGEYLTKAKAGIDEADSSIDALQAKLTEQADDTMAKLQGLRARISELSNESEALATEKQDQLRKALEGLEAAISTSFTALDEGARDKVKTLAEGISDEALQALERGLRNDTAETIGALEQAAAHASGVGREATIQLRDQLAKVNELTGNLEQRIGRARELAEEQVNNDFARRMALITDSLNSSAIDITGALATEVTDTAWDAYLKGDRGIFTRRAVRLIDNGGARDIAELYQSDEAFKANVSRYIHDFEAMLRSMLSTRDGNALSVTVLGSDMGKLYVLLAQAIERFRN